MAGIIGIDLGTTTSRVALMDGGRPVIIENSEGEGTTPSYVAIPEIGPRLVGEAALRYALTKPERVIFAVKRLIGRKYSDPIVKELTRFMPFEIVESDNGDAWVNVGGTQYSPAQITAFIIQKMKHTAEVFLGHKVTQAVISVPAYFDDQQRQAVIDAAAIADLQVLRVQAEPTMAALAYGLNIDNDSAQNIVVYDLGGGTFDVSILSIGEGVFEVKSTRSDLFLGGEDFDYKLMDYLSDIVVKSYGVDLMKDIVARQRLKQSAENIKIRLSSSFEAEIDLPFLYFDGVKSLHISKRIKRDIFEALIENDVDRSIEICKAAMDDAVFSKHDIDQIVLVGGSTRIPLVQRKITDFFGKTPYGGLRREDAVALGAAVEAGVLDGRVKNILLLDVTPMSLGLETLGGIFTRMIDRNTTIPTRKSQTFSTAEDNQTAVTVRVFQGEREMATDNKFLGQFDLIDIRPEPKGIPQIEVTFAIDANGIVDVSAKNKKTGKKQDVRIKAAGGLSPDEIFDMRANAYKIGISQIALISSIDINGRSSKFNRENLDESSNSSIMPIKNSIPQREWVNIYLLHAEADKNWADKIEKALGILTITAKIIINKSIGYKAGKSREERVSRSIEDSEIVIFLLSNDLLSSSLFLRQDIPMIFAEAERRQLVLLPILTRPCALDLHKNLSKFELFNTSGAALSTLQTWEIDAELSRLALHVANIRNSIVNVHLQPENSPSEKDISAPTVSPSRKNETSESKKMHSVSIVIATANERESAAIYKKMLLASREVKFDIETHTDPIIPNVEGRLKAKDGLWSTFLVQADETGGSDAVDLLRRVVTKIRPKYVFFVGCAALLDERHPISSDQVFVARSAYDADKYELTTAGSIYDMAQHRGDLSLIRNIEALKISGKFNNIKVETRRHFISGSVFLSDKTSQLRSDVTSRFPPDAVVWEMEAFSVLKSLFSLRAEGEDVGLAIIKGISDIGDHEAQADKINKQRIATTNAMSVVETLLKNLSIH